MPDMVILETEESMETRLESLSKELSKVRTGRANPRMLDDVKVDYYGALTPLSQIGNISVPEPSQLVVKPYDSSMLKIIEKAIMAANLGINPSNEGSQLRIILPALTTETRKAIVKDIHKLGEEYKVFIRNSCREEFYLLEIFKLLHVELLSTWNLFHRSSLFKAFKHHR